MSILMQNIGDIDFESDIELDTDEQVVTNNYNSNEENIYLKMTKFMGKPTGTCLEGAEN